MENQPRMNYVLVDFENVQPKNLSILANLSFKVFVFVGANNVKVPFDIAAAMQALGDNAQYIKISGNGKNALDFHMAYYLGRLVLGDPEAYFHVISKDSGFDPLIDHLKTSKIKVKRESDIIEIPILRMSNLTNDDERIAAIIKNLADRGPAKPIKVKTLSNTINAWFAKKLDNGDLTTLIEELQKRNYITVNGEKISYNLPKQL